MIKILLRRLAISVPVLIVVSFLTFALVSVTPGGAAYAILGQGATPEALARLKSELGLNEPLAVQYLDWLGRTLTGNLGNSLINGQPVGAAISQRLAPTISLLVSAIVVITVVGVGLGTIAATRGGPIARTIDLLSFGGLAVPNFVLALYLIPLFALTLRWLPASGYVPFGQSVPEWAASLVLPVIALSFGGVGIVAKQTRAAIDDVLSREFVSIMRANGYRRRSIIYKHVLKTAAMPIIAIVGVVFVGLISGTILVEAVFAFPGLGGLAVQASGQSDITLLVGVTVIFTLFVIVINYALDICYAAVNPKVATA
jgi:peptide/nickel transport system permease protein